MIGKNRKKKKKRNVYAGSCAKGSITPPPPPTNAIDGSPGETVLILPPRSYTYTYAYTYITYYYYYYYNTFSSRFFSPAPPLPLFALYYFPLCVRVYCYVLPRRPFPGRLVRVNPASSVRTVLNDVSQHRCNGSPRLLHRRRPPFPPPALSCGRYIFHINIINAPPLPSLIRHGPSQYGVYTRCDKDGSKRIKVPKDYAQSYRIKNYYHLLRICINPYRRRYC